MTSSTDDTLRYEQTHVHDVYESIASHFSQTRYKPWPVVARFLESQPIGSLGLDAGSGNGKYLHGHNLTNRSALPKSGKVPIGGRPPGELLEQEPRYLLLGLDRSPSLLSLSRTGSSDPELIYGDCLSLPLRAGLQFDFAISIAMLHHLATPERRLHAMRALFSVVRPKSPHTTGRLLVFVWAQEQGARSRRKWEKGTLLRALPINDMQETTQDTSALQDDMDISTTQDVFVPWVLTAPPSDKTASGSQTFNRYYHMFREGELEGLAREAAQSLEITFYPSSIGPHERYPPGLEWCTVLGHGWEADNWWIEVELGRTTSSSC